MELFITPAQPTNQSTPKEDEEDRMVAEDVEPSDQEDS